MTDKVSNSKGELPWHRRLHAALMPDYNRSATIYWWLAVVSGGGLLFWCLGRVAVMPPTSIAQLAALTALAISAGLFPVRIPGSQVSFAAGEVCIFLILLLFGPAAASVAAAGESAMASFRTSKRWTSRLGSPSMATLAMYSAGSLLESVLRTAEQRGVVGPVSLLALAIIFGFVYFLASATLMGGVARLRRGEHLLRMADAVGALRWVGLGYAGSALLSTLLYLVYLQAGFGVFAVTLPLLAMLLLVLHFYYRQQEAQTAMRQALAEVADREAAMQARESVVAAQHLREMQLSERRFHGAFTYAAIGMALLDLDGVFIQSNESLGKLLGKRLDEMVGLSFAGLLSAEDSSLFASKLALVHGFDFEELDLEVSLRCANEQYRMVNLHCSFFIGPAMHGAARAGIPCLLLQVQALVGPRR